MNTTECPACDCKYNTEAELMRHLYSKHQAEARDLSEEDRKAFIRSH